MPAKMTTQAQALAWDVIYSPFGATSYVAATPETQNMRFPGQWFQLESGLAYNWHRHYDATLGRYITPDPLGLPVLLSDGPSVYGYVHQNPLVLTDPAGTDPRDWRTWVRICTFLLCGKVPPTLPPPPKKEPVPVVCPIDKR